MTVLQEETGTEENQIIPRGMGIKDIQDMTGRSVVEFYEDKKRGNNIFILDNGIKIVSPAK